MRGVSMPFLKNKTLLSTLIASLILSPAAMSSVSDIKTSGSAKGYNLIGDSISSSRTNPGFVTNSLGSDNYSPKINLSGSRGKPAAIDLTNGTGAPAINLSRTHGYNGNISSLAANSSTKKNYRLFYSESYGNYNNTVNYQGTVYTGLSKDTHICALNWTNGRDTAGTVAISARGEWYLSPYYGGRVGAVCWER